MGLGGSREHSFSGPPPTALLRPRLVGNENEQVDLRVPPLLTAAAQAWSGDVYIGRRLPALLRQAGLRDVELDAHVCVFRPAHPYHQLLPRFLDIRRDRILASGEFEATELERRVQRLTAHLADPTTFTLYATLFSAWGRKPD
jgi:hypothetical protein